MAVSMLPYVCPTLRVSLLLAVLTCTAVRADVDLDQVDDVIRTTTALSALVTPTTVTLMAWVKFDGTANSAASCLGQSQLLMDWDNGLLSLGLNDTDGCAYVFDGSEQQVLAPLTTGWHHLALTLAGGTLTLFVDGVSVGTPVAAGAVAGLTGTLALGYTLGSRMAAARTYAVALPTKEIEAIALSRQWGAGRTQPTGRWPLDDCADGATGATVAFRDHSGNGFHATGQDGGTGGLVCRASELLRRPMWVQ